MKTGFLQAVIVAALVLFASVITSQTLDDLLRSAEQGDVYAQLLLGVIYDDGEEGVPENNAEAVRWYKLAAEQGSVEAQIILGLMYDDGDGVPENDVEAMHWYRMAAEQGNADAQFMLATMYALGDGVPKNDREAYIWSSLAVANDDNSNAAFVRDDAGSRLSPSVLASAQQEVAQRLESMRSP
ncbi:MAG: tetratricopeptide repeat protein [Pseudohongiellaceae bacterium]